MPRKKWNNKYLSLPNLSSLKTICLTKAISEQKLGYGAFGTVYRLSKYQVVKVIHKHYTEDEQLSIVNDEIKGAVPGKFYENPLPITDIVRVRCKNNQYILGIVKRYLPKNLGYRELHKKLTTSEWDKHEGNYRKDGRGRLWRVDTGTPACMRYMRDGREHGAPEPYSEGANDR